MGIHMSPTVISEPDIGFQFLPTDILYTRVEKSFGQIKAALQADSFNNRVPLCHHLPLQHKYNYQLDFNRLNI